MRNAIIDEGICGNLIDLYSGVGNLGKGVSDLFETTTFVESDPRCLEVLKAVRSKVEQGRTRIFPMRAETYLQLRNGDKFNLAIVDPPRAGLLSIASSVSQICDFLFYISCNPESLVSDLKVLSDDFHVVKSRCFDFFPCTSHIETATLLHKK